VVSVVFYLCAPVNASPKQGSDRRHMGVAQGGLDVEGVVLVDITCTLWVCLVRVDNQFGNSPFCSGAAWVCFFWRMYGLPTLRFFLFPILHEELELLFAYISGSDFRRGVFVETNTLLYIHY